MLGIRAGFCKVAIELRAGLGPFKTLPSCGQRIKHTCAISDWTAAAVRFSRGTAARTMEKGRSRSGNEKRMLVWRKRYKVEVESSMRSTRANCSPFIPDSRRTHPRRSDISDKKNPHVHHAPHAPPLAAAEMSTNPSALAAASSSPELHVACSPYSPQGETF